MAQCATMPIRPENRSFYPINWPQLSAVIRFGRAKGCCDGCGRPHGRMVYHLGDGRWWDVEAGRWRDGWGRRNWPSQAVFRCVSCGHAAHADDVAATNIERAGHARLACGDTSPVRESAQEPAEVGPALAA